jgi:hypothetical protein
LTSRAVALLVALLAACGSSQPPVSPVAPPGPPSTPPGPAVGELSELRASLHVPARVDFDPQSLGIARHFVSIRLENTGTHDVLVDHLHATFSAVRDGVAFQCNAHVRGAEGAIEPSHLAPGQSFTLERALDCTMPLPGRYELRVWIHHAELEGQERSRPGGGVYVGASPVEIVAQNNAPLAVPSHPGLYALLTGATVSAPMPSDAWMKGGYQVAVALVNGGPAPATLDSARVSLLVFKEGAGLPCAGREQPLDEPDVLAPGEVHVVRVPVTCAPTEPGRYTIVGRFVMGSGPQLEIGRVGLLAIRNPDLLFTTDWPPLPHLETP